MTETQHIDPTGFGLLLVAAVSFPLALENLLQDANYTMGYIADILGLAIIFVAYLAYKANSNFGMTVFGLVGIGVFLTGTGGSFIVGMAGNLALIGFAIIFLFFMIWAILIKGQKLLILLLCTTTLVFLTVGLSSIVDSIEEDTWGYIIGAVALFNFIFNFWLGAGLVTEGKIPYF